MNVAFYTLGCKVNQYETEAMKNLFKKNGYNIVEETENADIFIINSCTVTSASDRKTRQTIRKFRKKNTESIIIITGCYSQNYGEDLKKDLNIDIIIGTKEKSKILEITTDYIKNHIKHDKVKEFQKNEKYEEFDIIEWESRTRANIKIQDGCDQYCSYCIIPYVRGPSRSRDRKEILKEIENLSRKNYKEIIVNGINLTALGKDDNKGNLVDLTKDIDKLDIDSRIRFGSLDPIIINEEMMKTISRNQIFAEHFHLSLQSGSNSVLKRMNRNYTKEEFKEKVEIIRKYIPNCGITTDIIVGFPGETEEEFNETYDFVKKIGFSRIHVFKFSPREGTRAYKMKKKVNGKIKNKRSRKMIKLGEILEKKFCEKFLGKEVEVLFEKQDNEGFYEGYTSNYLHFKCKSKENLENMVKKCFVKNILDNKLVG
ncbi:MAG: tRNA (N(6)-L-threonylcarbamoyladenosine(37)-C(2))-methylthiotransferase MtaB [Eubacteriales bacterium]